MDALVRLCGRFRQGVWQGPPPWQEGAFAGRPSSRRSSFAIFHGIATLNSSAQDHNCSYTPQTELLKQLRYVTTTRNTLNYNCSLSPAAISKT